MTLIPEVWTLRDVLLWSTQFLKDKDLHASPRLDVECLLAYSLGCRRLDLYLEALKPLQQSERERFKSLLIRRAKGEPIAYIIGHKEFYGLDLKVGPGVLIPRPETELIIDEAQRILKEAPEHSKPISLLDLCTGSGCIALALKSLWGDKAHVEAMDFSTEALSWARKNSAGLGLEISWQQGDVLSAGYWSELAAHSFDLICVNPPYIAAGDPRVDSAVNHFEPSIALYAQDQGLAFYHYLAKQAHQALKPGGSLIMECGIDQASTLAELFSQSPWQSAEIKRDLAQIPRVIIAKTPH